MKKFSDFLIESQNKHLTHIEETMFEYGSVGVVDAINFLNAVKKMLRGNSQSRVNISTKWDGAPAVVVGIDPQNGKFFVGSKSVFNKTPKINYSERDIDINHPNPGLNSKLKTLFREFSQAKLNGVYQGDFLYSKEDIKKVNYDDEKLIGFQPNTILYTVPVKSNLASKIMRSRMGIVFHTTYFGNNVSTMKASFGFNRNSIKTGPSVWIADASFRDESGSSTFTKNETKDFNNILREIIGVFKTLDRRKVDFIVSDSDLSSYIKRYNNSKIRTGQAIGDIGSHYSGLVQFIKDDFLNASSKLKTDSAIEGKLQKSKEILKFVSENRTELLKMFSIMNLIITAKQVVLNKLQMAKSIGTFIETPDGLKVTAPEGFVVSDRMSENAVKLVDRLEFSHANFNVIKSWK